MFSIQIPTITTPLNQFPNENTYNTNNKNNNSIDNSIKNNNKRLNIL
jgi:hypothetical protein